MSKLKHLSQQQLSLLKEFTGKIVQTIAPVQVLCYGTRHSNTYEWTTFNFDDTSVSHSSTVSYDLIVVTQNKENRPDHEIIQAIEQQAPAYKLNVTSVILKESAFDKSLSDGWRFFTTAYYRGAMLYDSNPSVIYVPQGPPEIRGLIHAIQQHWSYYFTGAKGFYNSAEDNLKRGWTSGVMLSLHQATQHTCMALLRAFTGYRSATHNLSRLLELIKNFSPEPSSIFPCNTAEERELFTILKNSYSDSRYKEDFTVPQEKVDVLMRRVKTLMEIAQVIYETRLQTFVLSAPITFPLLTKE
ncbi:HEPN domain-containing protein [Filimonas effusa]|uniref:HEPN domain-containing protein n=1 Tax=Filimonas effusa TaxID=2508721 RepID=A0A4V1M9I5_9BACT|nr:HEPN domain-containing protein [Filimonas effusa]RXK81268.1 HEPN domain-containing protein [Filimonas effusa]